MNGIVNTRKSWHCTETPLPHAAPENSCQTCRSLNDAGMNLAVNHKAGKIHVHFAGSLRHVRHIPNPIRPAQTMLMVHSFHRTTASECAGITSPKAVSTTAVPRSATSTFSRTSPQHLRARNMSGFYCPGGTTTSNDWHEQDFTYITDSALVQRPHSLPLAVRPEIHRNAAPCIRRSTAPVGRRAWCGRARGKTVP